MTNKNEKVTSKEVKLEVNFKDKVVVRPPHRAVFMKEDVWDNLLVPNLGSEWHLPDKDEIEYLIFYWGGEYLCQKKKIVTDSEGNQYWRSYNYPEASTDEANRIYELFDSLAEVQKHEKTSQFIEESKKLIDYQYYYEAKYVKRTIEVRSMLLFSDWRMLPDYQEEFDGELEMWKKWRQHLRDLLPNIETFENKYEAFKFATTVKFAVDPNNYFKLYPNGQDADGNPVEYMGTEDQFTKLDFKASTDFVTNNIMNVLEYVNKGHDDTAKITRKYYELMETLNAWDFFPDLRMELLHVED